MTGTVAPADDLTRSFELPVGLGYTCRPNATTTAASKPPATSPCETASVVLELLVRLLPCRDVHQALVIAAESTRIHLNAEFVAIGLSLKGSRPAGQYVVAGELVSALPAHEIQESVLCALGECVVTGRSHRSTRNHANQTAAELQVADYVDDDAVHPCAAGYAHLQLQVNLHQAPWLYSTPLLNEQDEVVGAILIAHGDDDAIAESTRLLSSLAVPFAEAIQLLATAAPHPLVAQLTSIKAFFLQQRSRTVLLASTLAVAIACFPARYPVHAKATLEPTVRRWISAPFAGRLERLHVSPGQSVNAGDVLASLDVEESRNQLQRVQAELERLQAERATHLASGRIADATVAMWNAKKAESESALLQTYIERGVIRSPIQGVILTKELERFEGAPVEVGQTLMEIGRLDSLYASIEVPTDQIGHVSLKSKASLNVEAISNSIAPQITHIHPRAEEDGRGRFVFFVKAEITDRSSALRPGMQGSAVLYGEYRPYAWCLIQRVWQRLKAWSRA